MSGSQISLRGIKKSYPSGKLETHVLRGIDLDIDAGDAVAIVGPSGSGKSTLLNIMGGLDSQYTGKAHVAGQDLDQLNDRQLSLFRNQKVGFVFQQFNLLEHLSCQENVAIPAVFAAGGVADPQGRAHAALERVGLGDMGPKLAANLSGGQKQRVAIARALFCQPEILLCDEPTGNLDSRSGRQIIELFTELNRNEGVTLVTVTHETRVSEAASRVVSIEDGLLQSGAVAHGDPDDAPDDDDDDDDGGDDGQ